MGYIEIDHTVPGSIAVGIKLYYNAKVIKDCKLISAALGNFII